MMVFAKKGFTLVELLIVIAIIGLLALLALPRFWQAIAKTKEARALEVMYQIRAFALAQETVDGDGNWGPYVEGGYYTLDLGGDGKIDYSLRIPIDDNYDFDVQAGSPITSTAFLSKCGKACDDFVMEVDTGKLTRTFR